MLLFFSLSGVFVAPRTRAKSVMVTVRRGKPWPVPAVSFSIAHSSARLRVIGVDGGGSSERYCVRRFLSN